MMKKTILPTLFFIVITLISDAQSRSVRDSLLNRLRSTQPDTDHVKALNALGYEYYLYKPDTTYLLGQQAYKIAQEISFAPGEARALVTMGLGLSLLGDYPKAIKVYSQARQLYHEQGNINGEITALNNIAASYGEQENWANALEAMREVYRVYQSISNANPAVKPIYLLNLGEAFYNVKQYDSAIIYLAEGLPLAKDNHEVYGNILYDLGDVALARNEFDKARHYYQQCIDEFLSTDSYQAWYEGYYRLARYSRQTAKPDSAMYFAHRALDASEKASYPRGILKSSQLLSTLYEGKNDAKALHYYKMAVAAKDSIYSQEKIKQMLSLSFEEKQQQMQIAAAKAQYRNQVRVYVLAGVLVVIAVIAMLLLRHNNQRKKAYDLLQQQKQETDIQKEKAESTLSELKSTQAQLIQSEKMASLGELTAGIAHEIQNPLNFVNNFSEVNNELINELVNEVDKGNIDEVKAIANDIKENQGKINYHGKRADAIVKGMLQHSRTSTGVEEATDINKLAGEYLRLAYHGFRAKDKAFNTQIKTDFDASIEKINVVPQDIGRVLLNLFNNAFYATNEKKQKLNGAFEPVVSVSTKKENGNVILKVTDNGNGIPQNIVDKIFQPFFTTKPTGQGTGLGLSLSYDIIKAHGGEIKVETKENAGSEFIIQVPYNP